MTDAFCEDAAAYLLGALEEEEARAFEAHVPGCAACRRELDELRVAAEALPASVPLVAPPPELQARLMRDVEREATLLAAAAEGARPGSRRGVRRPALSGRDLAPALVALGAGLLIGLAAGGGFSRGARSVAVKVDPSMGRAQARLELRDGTATLVAQHLRAPPPGHVYQVWLQRGRAAPQPTAALFTPRRDGSAMTGVVDARGADSVLVSIEPAGGSPAPTTRPVLVARTS